MVHHLLFAVIAIWALAKPIAAYAGPDDVRDLPERQESGMRLESLLGSQKTGDASRAFSEARRLESEGVCINPYFDAIRRIRTVRGEIEAGIAQLENQIRELEAEIRALQAARREVTANRAGSTSGSVEQDWQNNQIIEHDARISVQEGELAWLKRDKAEWENDLQVVRREYQEATIARASWRPPATEECEEETGGGIGRIGGTGIRVETPDEPSMAKLCDIINRLDRGERLSKDEQAVLFGAGFTGHSLDELRAMCSEGVDIEVESFGSITGVNPIDSKQIEDVLGRVGDTEVNTAGSPPPITDTPTPTVTPPMDDRSQPEPPTETSKPTEFVIRGVSSFIHDIGSSPCSQPAGNITVLSASADTHPKTISNLTPVTGSLAPLLIVTIVDNHSVAPQIRTEFNCAVDATQITAPVQFSGSFSFKVTDTVTDDSKVITIQASGTVKP